MFNQTVEVNIFFHFTFTGTQLLTSKNNVSFWDIISCFIFFLFGRGFFPEKVNQCWNPCLFTYLQHRGYLTYLSKSRNRKRSWSSPSLSSFPGMEEDKIGQLLFLFKFVYILPNEAVNPKLWTRQFCILLTWKCQFSRDQKSQAGLRLASVLDGRLLCYLMTTDANP